jgi:7 transmembrane receptor (Secretin family)
MRSQRFQILRSLCSVLLVSQVLFLLGSHLRGDPLYCPPLAVFMHFFFLTVFAWKLAKGINFVAFLSTEIHVSAPAVSVATLNHGDRARRSPAQSSATTGAPIRPAESSPIGLRLAESVFYAMHERGGRGLPLQNDFEESIPSFVYSIIGFGIPLVIVAVAASLNWSLYGSSEL